MEDGEQTMIREQLETLSPIQPACLVDGRRPACQSGLADLIRSQDAADLREILAKIADTHAFSWDAYDMLGRVCDYLFAESRKNPYRSDERCQALWY